MVMDGESVHGGPTLLFQRIALVRVREIRDVSENSLRVCVPDVCTAVYAAHIPMNSVPRAQLSDAKRCTAVRSSEQNLNVSARRSRVYYGETIC
jgi:hypothetical protein